MDRTEEREADLLKVLRHKYGELIEVVLEGEAGPMVFWFKKPSRALMMTASNMSLGGQITQAGELLLRDCLLEEVVNDTGLLDDDQVYVSLCLAALNLVSLKKTSFRVC